MEDADRLVEAMMARRGGGEPMPHHRVLARLDPETLEAYEGWYGRIIRGERAGGLTPAERELAIITACAVLHEAVGVRLHVQKARALGVPARKIYEAAMLAGPLAGIPAMRDALVLVAEQVPSGELNAIDTREGERA